MLVVGPEGRRLEISRAEQLVDEREGFAVHPMGDIFSPRVPCSRENAEETPADEQNEAGHETDTSQSSPTGDA